MESRFQNIRNVINALFEDKFGIDLIQNGFEKDNFFGKSVQLCASDVVYIFFEMEKKYSISLTPDIQSKKFYTLDGLSEIIGNKLS